MRKRKNRLSLYLTAKPNEQGRTPDYAKHLQRPNLDGGHLIPSIETTHRRNCKTINRLQAALKRIADNKTRLSSGGSI